MKRYVAPLLGLLALGAVLTLLLPGAQRSSVLLIIREPALGEILDPGASPPAARVDRLAGAGVRLPLRPPTLLAPDFLDALLGPPAPARSLLGSLAREGWSTVLSSAAPIHPELGGRVDHLAAPGVDAALGGLDALDVRPGQPAMVAVLLQPATGEEWGLDVGRLIDGAAPRLVPARTLVVLVERGENRAVLVGPEPAPPIPAGGALSPEALGEFIGEWLQLP